MAEDKEREANRIAKAAEAEQLSVARPMTAAIKRIATQGVVKRPLTPRVARGF